MRIFYPFQHKHAGMSKLNFISGPEVVKNCDPCFMALPITINASNFSAYNSIKFLESQGVESRPLIAGNLLKHPASKINNIRLHNHLHRL